MRLAKYLADKGVASRRKSETLIAQGRVTVNGIIINEQGIKIDPLKDEVKVDGLSLESAAKVYILLNKPAGYISSVSDPWGRPVVTDLIQETDLRIYPVGRLDFDTEGLLLLSNDGNFANHIIHPRYKIDKKYVALVKGKVNSDTVQLLQRGVLLDDGLTAPASVIRIKVDSLQTLLEITIHEGRKRQVKRMLAAVGHPIIKLQRTEVAFLNLKGLSPGQYRYLNSEEVERLMITAQNK